MIRVLIVDDHPVVREGLVAALEDEKDIRIAGTAGSAEEALALAPSARPHVVLLDLELPGLSGIEAIPRLAVALPDAGVIVLTAYDADERVLGAVQAGARGYVLKGASVDEITRAIRAVHAGGSYLTSPVAAKVLGHVRSPRRTMALSPRERAVLREVAAGRSTKQIARSLGITERTVKFHVSSIMNKLGAGTRAQAVAEAAKRGLLERG
ncbi:MAG TPA: response regulator transcription factor [bacterium]|nr:response regulator transcription factor [bacterium]